MPIVRRVPKDKSPAAAQVCERRIRDCRATSHFLNFAFDHTSQGGEDGILAEIFHYVGSLSDPSLSLPSEDIYTSAKPFCVEIGAWDGKHLSNTYSLLHGIDVRNLRKAAKAGTKATKAGTKAAKAGTKAAKVENLSPDQRTIPVKEWCGLLVEANSERCACLSQMYKDRPDEVVCLDWLVDIEGPQSLRSIMDAYDVPEDFDFLCIDIDGADYHIWESLHAPRPGAGRSETAIPEQKQKQEQVQEQSRGKVYRPRVVCIEFNPTIPNHVAYVQARSVRVQEGSSLRALAELGVRLGYQLVCTTTFNALFLRQDLLPRLPVAWADALSSVQPFKAPSQPSSVHNCEVRNEGKDGVQDGGQTRVSPRARLVDLNAFHSADMVSDLFQTYQGELKLCGTKKLLWHKVGFNLQQMQPLRRKQDRVYPFAPPTVLRTNTTDTAAATAAAATAGVGGGTSSSGGHGDPWASAMEAALERVVSSLSNPCSPVLPAAPDLGQDVGQDLGRDLLALLNGCRDAYSLAPLAALGTQGVFKRRRRHRKDRDRLQGLSTAGSGGGSGSGSTDMECGDRDALGDGIGLSLSRSSSLDFIDTPHSQSKVLSPFIGLDETPSTSLTAGCGSLPASPQQRADGTEGSYPASTPSASASTTSLATTPTRPAASPGRQGLAQGLLLRCTISALLALTHIAASRSPNTQFQGERGWGREEGGGGGREGGGVSLSKDEGSALLAPCAPVLERFLLAALLTLELVGDARARGVSGLRETVPGETAPPLTAGVGVGGAVGREEEAAVALEVQAWYARAYLLAQSLHQYTCHSERHGAPHGAPLLTGQTLTTSSTTHAAGEAVGEAAMGDTAKNRGSLHNPHLDFLLLRLSRKVSRCLLCLCRRFAQTLDAAPVASREPCGTSGSGSSGGGEWGERDEHVDAADALLEGLHWQRLAKKHCMQVALRSGGAGIQRGPESSAAAAKAWTGVLRSAQAEEQNLARLDVRWERVARVLSDGLPGSLAALTDPTSPHATPHSSVTARHCHTSTLEHVTAVASHSSGRNDSSSSGNINNKGEGNGGIKTGNGELVSVAVSSALAGAAAAVALGLLFGAGVRGGPGAH